MSLTPGMRLKQVREDRRISQAELAKSVTALGYKWSQATVWAVEDSGRKLSLMESVSVCSVLGITLDWLAGIDTDSVDTYAQGFHDGASWFRYSMNELVDVKLGVSG